VLNEALLVVGVGIVVVLKLGDAGVVEWLRVGECFDVLKCVLVLEDTAVVGILEDAGVLEIVDVLECVLVTTGGAQSFKMLFMLSA